MEETEGSRKLEAAEAKRTAILVHLGTSPEWLEYDGVRVVR